MSGLFPSPMADLHIELVDLIVGVRKSIIRPDLYRHGMDAGGHVSEEEIVRVCPRELLGRTGYQRDIAIYTDVGVI
jgi:hypothetical protein